MPMIDMPLEELRGYTGSSPCPADFDRYWAEALAELDSVDPQPELVPVAFPAAGVECFDLYYTSVKNARIHAKYLRPKGAGSCPVVLMFHGYTWSCGDWMPKLGYVYQGCAVAAMDCRGQGGPSQDVGGVWGNTVHGHIIRGLDDPDNRNLMYRDIFLDTVQLARVTASFAETDESRMVTTGNSQGGALAIACAALTGWMRGTVAQHPFLSDYRRVWQMDMTVKAYSDLTEYFRRHDPRHEREDQVFEKLGYIDIQNLTPRIHSPVLVVTGLMDDTCPPSSVFAAYNKLGGPKEIILYPDYAHEYMPDYDDICFARLLQYLQDTTKE